jgi:hypothetical protein
VDILIVGTVAVDHERRNALLAAIPQFTTTGPR